MTVCKTDIQLEILFNAICMLIQRLILLMQSESQSADSPPRYIPNGAAVAAIIVMNFL